METEKKIILLDFCSEKNRGDAAMQVGLLKLVFKYFRDPIISIVSVFGANQASKFIYEYDHSLKWPVSIYGGLKPTFFPIGSSEVGSKLISELKQGIFFFFSLVLLFFLAIKAPFSLIRKIVPDEYYNTIERIRDAGFVIWNGRNFRSRSNQLIELYRIMHVVYHPLVCISLSKPIACIGASVWHLNNPISRLILKYTFNKCFFISLREESSYNETIKLLGEQRKNKVSLLPDLSFAVYDVGAEVKKKRAPISNNPIPKTIGLTIVDWVDDGEVVRNNYKNAMAGVIDFYLKHNSKIVIIPQVTKRWEDSNSLISEILNLQKNKDNISIINDDLMIKDLLSIYSKIDFLIATRMHSAIFASFVGTPLIAISYDRGGKWSIIKELGYEDFLFNYSDVNSLKLINSVQSFWASKNIILDNINNAVLNYSTVVDLNIKILIDTLEFMGKQIINE